MGAAFTEQNANSDQRRALIESLFKPRTGSELLLAMQQKNCLHVHLRDIWRALKTLQERGLVYCLTPGAITGRLYFFTDRGQEFALAEYGVSVEALPHGVNWQRYSEVVRGLARKTLLVCMNKPWLGRHDKTTADVRRLSLQVDHPLCMAAAIRGMRELEQLKLIERIGVTFRRERPLYRLTPAGKRILAEIERPSPIPNASASNLIKTNDVDTT